MEERVKDAILTNEFTDLVLLRLVEITIAAIREGRALFPGPLQEPVFYRKHFHRWVREALDEQRMMEEAQSLALYDTE